MTTPALQSMNGNLFGCTIALKPPNLEHSWIGALVQMVVVQPRSGEIQNESKTE